MDTTVTVINEVTSVNVTNEVINVEVTNTDAINVDVIIDPGLPSISIVTAEQGPEGKKGDKGEKGDPLTYDMLTPADKQEMATAYDAVIGNNSYANIFLNTLLN